MSTKNQFGPKGWTPELMKSQKGKTFLVTGTTSGTGYEAAKILASKGAKVVMLNRNPKKSEDTIASIKKELSNNIDISYITIDLGNQDSVKKASEEILKSVSRIDALICNAAIAQVPTRKLIGKGWESQMGVNYFGHFTLQGMLYPLIEKSKGRVVTVGSMGYNMGIKTINFEDMSWEKGYNANTAYSQSKLAQIMTIYELQDRLEKAGKTDVKAYACHPGSSRTSLIKNSGSLMMRIMFVLMTPLTQSSERGSYPSLLCATEEDLDQKGFYGPTGRSFWTGPVGEHKIEPHAKDMAIAKKLWDLSEKETGISWNI